MENKYITVAYRLYAIADGKKEMIEEAPAEHPFQFVSGLGYTLDRFEKEITALSKGDNFSFTIPCAEAYGERIEENVQAVDKAILGFLDAENVKYSVITGSTKERSEAIMKIVGINNPVVQPIKLTEVKNAK